MSEIVTPAAAPAPTTEVKPETAPPANATPAEKKIWKLKADGQEFEFDASDEEAVKREIMKARGAGKRFEEAAAMRRQAEQFLEMLRNDPRAVLTNPKLGLDFKKIAEDYLWEQIQEEKMTPEQKRQRDVEKQLAEYREAEKKAKAEHEERQRLELQRHYEADYEKKILSALDAGGVPKTNATVRRMAFYLQQALQHNIPVEPSELVARVKKDYMDEHREMYQSAEGDTLISLVGEELAKKIRVSDMQRLKSTQGSQFQTPEPKPLSQKKDQRPKKLNGADWRKQLMLESGVAKRSR